MIIKYIYNQLLDYSPQVKVLFLIVCTIANLLFLLKDAQEDYISNSWRLMMILNKDTTSKVNISLILIQKDYEAQNYKEIKSNNKNMIMKWQH